MALEKQQNVSCFFSHSNHRLVTTENCLLTNSNTGENACKHSPCLDFLVRSDGIGQNRTELAGIERIGRFEQENDEKTWT